MADAKHPTRPMRRTGPPGGRRSERFVEKEAHSAVESIREATGASVDVIQYHLRECGGDVNKATEELIDTPFTVVQSKKPKNKTLARGRGRGRDSHNGRGSRYEAAGRGRGGGQGPMRGRGGIHRNRMGPRPKTGTETPMANGTVVEKAKSAPPPLAPRRKDYLEAVRGKSRKPHPPPMTGEATTSNALGQNSEGMSGWEVASPPPDTPVAAFHEEEEATMPDEVVVSDEEKKPVQVDSTADVRGVQVKEDVASWAEEVEDDKTGDAPAEDIPSAHIFPIAMQDIRFTREDTTPLEPSSLPIPFRMDAAFTPSLNVEDSPLDMSTIGYLFGTFEGLRKSQPDAETQTEPEEIVERPLEDTPPLQPASSGTPPEPEVTERPESPSLRTEESTNEGRSPLQRPSVELLPATVDAASPPPQTEPASDFRMDAETQALDVEVPQPPAEQPSFIATSNPAVKEETSTSVHSHLVTTDAPRSDKPFVNAMTSQTKPSQQLTTLEDAPEFVKPYGEGFGVPVENPKTEEIGNFEESRPPHRPSPNLQESKPVLETDSSFGISSGPAPTLPSYQPQRHPPPHKLQEKSVPSVGAGVTGHPPNTKYNPHATGGGVPPPGPNPNPAVHVPSSLNPTNSGNSSVPMMQQAPFLNPGMMPNPAIPFPTGTPYYPQFMQYQHQMYHGLYAGTYGGFGAPFNHESVGHPAHASPVGVPPNQGNQPFTVSFPTSLCPLGNTVYDTANPSSFVNNKEKDVFLNQQQQQQLSHAGFPGGPQPVVPRNDGGMFYGVPGQAFSQGFRNQFHQPPGFGQFPGAGFVAPPHTYHPPGQQGTPNFRLH